MSDGHSGGQGGDGSWGYGTSDPYSSSDPYLHVLRPRPLRRVRPVRDDELRRGR